MEHSALHALQLIGQLLALGGPLLVLGFLRPARRALGAHTEPEPLAAELERSATRWVCYGALAAALGTLADYFVQAAELEGKTVFSGVSLPLVARFAVHTTVGQLGLARAGTLLLTALAVRWTGRGRWWFVLIMAVGAITLTSLVSHAAAQPRARTGAIATQALHICGAAAWLGILLHLLMARSRLESATGSRSLSLTAEMVRRFSPWAMTAVALLFCSGLAAVNRLVGEPAALLTSAYGLTLLLKLLLLAVVLYAGYRNYSTMRPALLRLVTGNSNGQASPLHRAPKGRARCAQGAAIPQKHRPNPGVEDNTSSPQTVCASSPAGRPPESNTARAAARRSVLRAFGRTLELEVTAGLLVITVAGILGSVSPPGQAGIQRLTDAQAQALRHPHWPRTAIVNPDTFYGAPERTLTDLQYAEFTHNWSGVAVCFLGLCWLVQSRGGQPGVWAGRLWPGLLVLFGVFIGLASDPEVWWLRRVTLWQAVADPQLLEHQLGAGMVFGLAGAAWCYRCRARGDALLGYALPGIMIFGSLLLLGHAHSTLNATQEVTNLINVQHAVFGTFGLLAGMVRWLSLRSLMPARWAAWLWPALVIGLGLFMAFVYRETTL